MSKNKRIIISITLLVGTFLAAAYFLLSAHPVEAKSLVCKKYDKYREDYRNSINRARYHKTKWLKEHSKKTFEYYKGIYEKYKNYSDEDIEKLSKKTRDIFIQFRGYKRYQKYLDYKERCNDDDDDETYEHQMLSFSLSDSEENATIEGTINQTNHTINLDAENNIFICSGIASLVPTIEISSGATVNPLSGVANDFSSEVTYTVTGGDDVSQAYAVTVDTSGCPN